MSTERRAARAIVLVDGEHYPPVLLDAIESLRRGGADVVGAVLLGGGEKLSGPLELPPIQVITGASPRDALERGIDAFAPDEAIDLSDAPVLDVRRRFLLASAALARGVAYRGGDFRFEPPPRAPVRGPAATIAVIGTGKRTGKTAVAAALARRIRDAGRAVVVVAMGRGGPAEPVVTREPPSLEDLLARAARGEHAATDSLEDALVAGVTTVGARRAGAGLAGATVFDTVAEAFAVAEAEEPDVIVLEGSGTAIPPVAADATVLVAGGATGGDLASGLGFYRVLLSDLVVVTMAEEPILSSETLSALDSLVHELARDVRITRTVFRPDPLRAVSGRKAFLATTAPEGAGPALRRHLEEVHGATVVGITHRLADRPRLSEELAKAEGTYEVLITELKAAAIDVAARAAVAAGAEVVFTDNVPLAVEGDLGAEMDALVALAEERARTRR